MNSHGSIKPTKKNKSKNTKWDDKYIIHFDDQQD